MNTNSNGSCRFLLKSTTLGFQKFIGTNLDLDDNFDIPGSPPKLRQFGFKEISAYTEATWSSNMSYERKFYGLS